jgi:cyclase
MKRIVLGVFIGWALMLSGWTGRNWWVNRQPPPPPAGTPPPVEEISKIAENLYLVRGGGCNTGVFVTANGVLVVDTKFAESWPRLVEEIRKVTDKPITHVVNTHAHGDHILGNLKLSGNVEVFVHENTALNMEESRQMWDPQKEYTRPFRTFEDKVTLFSGQEAVDLYHFGHGHTNGDTLVVYRAARVMQAGDLFPGKIAPTINVAWGGNARMFSETLAEAASNIHDVDRVITGHGRVFPWSDFVAYGEFYDVLLDHARVAARAGKTRDEAIADFKLPNKFQGYQITRIRDLFGEMFRFYL